MWELDANNPNRTTVSAKKNTRLRRDILMIPPKLANNPSGGHKKSPNATGLFGSIWSLMKYPTCGVEIRMDKSTIASLAVDYHPASRFEKSLRFPDLIHRFGVDQRTGITQFIAKIGSANHAPHHLGIARLWKIAYEQNRLWRKRFSHLINYHLA